jgi:hypothetical protein
VHNSVIFTLRIFLVLKLKSSSLKTLTITKKTWKEDHWSPLNQIFMQKKPTKAIQFAFTLVLLTITFSCQKSMQTGSANSKPGGENEIAPKELKNFVQLNLVGNNNSYNPLNIDANLVNAWGISFPPAGPAWVSSEGKGVGTIYNLDGITAASAVSIPHALSTTTGHPTGHVYNPSSDFKLLMVIQPPSFLLLLMVLFPDGTLVLAQLKR